MERKEEEYHIEFMMKAGNIFLFVLVNLISEIVEFSWCSEFGVQQVFGKQLQL